jgi:hypothetical protein
MRRFPRALALLLALPAFAQDRWALPERGGAIYRRVIRVDVTTEPRGEQPPDLWTGPTQAGIVLAGELDASLQALAPPLWDWRELVARVGLELRGARAGKSVLVVGIDERFHPVRVDVVRDAPGADGRQEFRATIELDAKAMRREDAPPSNAPRIRGSVRGVRTLDRARGIVARVSGRAELQVEVPAWDDGERRHPARQATIVVTDEWTDPVVHAPRDPAFELRITDAIRKSIAHLRGALAELTARPFEAPAEPHLYTAPGELALLLLTLRHAGEDVRDPLLVDGYRRLRACVIEGTYSLATAMLAVEALYTPPAEWAQLRAGALRAPLPRAVPAGDLELLRGWARALLANTDPAYSNAERRAWGYGAGSRWDNSNTQYALLGLYAGALCGVDVAPGVWASAAAHLLEHAEADGRDTVPDLVRQRDLDKGGRARQSAAKLQPRGWSYETDTGVTASMTAAGIGGLTLCGAALRVAQKGSPKLLTQIDDAVRAGFVWLQNAFTVRRSAGSFVQSNVWHLYYLYGLERACELNQIALLGGRDWYFEGAMHLVATQTDGGAWPGDLHDSAFALLFLKKAALPAITGR